jgi:tetratricopeptide (TPR) repeat protein
MLAFASMMCGRSAQADRATREMLAAIPEEFVQAAAIFIDGFYSMPYELHVRFGRWDAMLAEPAPRDIFPLSRALWHYARGAAYAAKKDLENARREQKEFETRRAAIPAEAAFGNNSSTSLAAIAGKLLEAEIQFHAGNTEAALAAAGEAVNLEDSLRYDEPPDWILPTRHVLGAMLLEGGRAEEAEKTYREELVKYPDNGWSLVGLARSLEAQKKDAGDLRRRFAAVWKEGDVPITSSCLCLPAK